MRSPLVWIVLGATAIIAASPVLPAAAHATYESSNPPDGGTVSSPPSQVTAEFSEPLIPDNSYMDVTDPCGGDVGGETSVTAKTMTVDMSASHKGTYVVSWRAHSSVDGHVTTGSFSFDSSGGEACPGDGGGGAGADRNRGGAGAAGSRDSVDSGESVPSEDDASRASATRGDADNDANDRRAGDKGGKHSTSHRRSRSGRGDGDEGGPVAQGAVREVPPAPSALEGIPIDGLMITLAVSALIGAAAAKIYVSLSGDRS
ncbi:MAG: copper resistance protein CopC [Actinobacteria bacterium]|nr:copper resistance protein CopC [Actinomycetota bacterium]